MNADRLLDLYDRISDAPAAIFRLRGFILDLAVRGKLVSQERNDEPASRLLKRIAVERAELVRTGKIKKVEVDSVALNDAPFHIPGNWAWTRLGSIGDWGSGSTPPRGRLDLYGGGITWLKSGELNDSRLLLGSEETVTKLALEVGSFRLNRSGDVLLAMYGATIGKVAILGEDGVTNQAVCGCTPFRGVLNTFLFLFLLSQRSQFRAASEGGAQPNISKVKIIWTPCPLPPLLEQDRIVSKVDELMALCDQLEASRLESETRRECLTATAFKRLNQAHSDAAIFRNDIAFVLGSLKTLTAKPEQIKYLRESILHLAIRGKLTAQHEKKDEPASELLRQIADAKARALAAGKTKRIKELAALVESDLRFPIPVGWSATRLGHVYDVRDGTHDTPKYVSEGYPLVTSKNLSSGKLSFEDVKLISEQDHRQISERSNVEKGDLLLAMIGSIGNPVIVDTERPFSIKNVALFKYFDPNLACPGFLRLFLEYAAAEMRELAAGGLQPFVSLGFLRAYPIVLPPLAEQHRICAKVDELMGLCEGLEASLGAGNDRRGRLLDALLAEALALADQAAV